MNNGQKLHILKNYTNELPEFAYSYIVEYYNGESINTQIGYCIDLKVFFHYLKTEVFGNIADINELTTKDIDKVTVSDLIHFKNYLKEYTVESVSVTGKPISRTYRNSAYGVNRKLSAVRGMFIYLYKTDQIRQNITDKIDFMKLHQKIKKPLTAQETVALLDVIYNGEKYFTDRTLTEYKRRKLRDIAIFTTYLGTGVRVSELASLNAEDIDFNTSSFIVRRKGGDEQEIFMPLQVENALTDYLRINEEEIRTKGPLFTNRSGKRLGIAGIEKMLKTYCHTVGIMHPDKTRPHALRRTFACRLLEDGIDIKMVAELLGHKNIEVTHRYYAQYSQQAKKEIVQKIVVYPEDKINNDSE
ncbi:MAG: hypothetical protein E7397_02110 [Ruminococcaceae bacterium]|nr:hypothetical protein [Oscillospiraceae bacterium]